jgi:phosphoesterase RecJ-like protein
MIPPELLDGLRNAQRVLVVSHVKPDGDAIGSLLALGNLLAALGKAPHLSLQDPVPAIYRILPGADAIVGPRQDATGFDTIIALDCSSLDRLGNAFNPAFAHLPLLVIDHHVTNARYGNINWVAPECAATCQMLLLLADALDVAVDTATAQCLLTGLVTDTLCFRTNNTTDDVLAAGMRLLQMGGNLTQITENILDQRSFAVIRLWGEVLDAAQLEQGVIWVTISRAQFAACGANGDDGSLSSLLIRTEGADISATFAEKLGESGGPAVECSFRARSGFDISGVAKQLGGGGHPAAGGCTVTGTLAEAVAQVVPLLQQARAHGLSTTGM